MLESISEGLKNILLAGIGAISVTAEKSKQIIEELVKKGEITVEQGKALNEELKHKAKEKTKEVADAVSDAVSTEKDNVENIMSRIKSMSNDEIEQLKEKLENLKSEDANDNNKGTDDQEV